MFGRKTKQIATLQARLDRVREQRDYHQGRADSAQAITTRTAAKFTDNHDLKWIENAPLHDQTAGYQNLLARHARLVRACARYLDHIWWLQRENADLHGKVSYWSGTGTDRALRPAEPVPVDIEMTRRLRDIDEQIAALQALVDDYQQREEKNDWARAGVTPAAA